MQAASSEALHFGELCRGSLIDPSLGIISMHLLSALHFPTGTVSLKRRRNTVDNAASSTQISGLHTLPHPFRLSTTIMVHYCLQPTRCHLVPRVSNSKNNDTHLVCFQFVFCAHFISWLSWVCGLLAGHMPGMPVVLNFRLNSTKVHKLSVN